MRTPRSLDLEITSRCNASCRYCYYLNNQGVTYQDMSTERWLAFFTELAECRVMNVSLLGGEPLLRDDFFGLINGIVANKMRFDLMSNGSLLTAETAERLAATRRCDQVQISLDGSTAEVHESLRGPGTFEPALAAIGHLQNAGVRVTVRVTVHPGNIDDLANVASLLFDDLGLPRFSTNSASALGSYDKYDETIFMTPVQRLQAMHNLADLDVCYPDRIEANAGPLADWKMFHAMEAARQSGDPIPERGRLVGCGCTFQRLAVRADGAYIPCVMLPQMVLGQVVDDALPEIWTRAVGLVALRERRSIELNSFAECRDCPWLGNCTGNCPGTAFTLTGAVDRPCPSACLKRFQQELEELGLSLWERDC
jgi:SynChlorMet cassette radical SAM/SPASM protein ScmE